MPKGGLKYSPIPAVGNGGRRSVIGRGDTGAGELQSRRDQTDKPVERGAIVCGRRGEHLLSEPESVMDVRFINPFIAAIKNVFSTMVKTDVTIGKPMIRPGDHRSADVSGVIGLSGDVAGAVVLSFPKEVACRLASAFAGTELTVDDEDFTDAIGELANMVAGNAKKDLSGFSVSISLPSVIVGAGHTVSQSAKAGPQLVIPCQSPFGPFEVEVAMVAKKSAVAELEAVGAA